MTTREELEAGKCRHLDVALNEQEVTARLAVLTDWKREDGKIVRQLAFRNYYETLAFVNAAAYIFHVEDHHPELVVGYNRCTVKFDTHSVNGGRGGLSENDFICAAKVDMLFSQAPR